MTAFARTLLALVSALPMIASAQPAQNGPVEKADPAAYRMLETAFLARQHMPLMKSLSGDLVYVVDGKSYQGTFAYTPGEKLQLTLVNASEDVVSTVRAQVGSIFGHRRGGEFKDGDGRYPLTFEGEETPLGRKIVLHDKMNSSYRVKGDEIIEVDRAMGGERFVVTMLENIRTPEGKTLPKHFTVSYFDPETKALFKSDSISDSYTQVDGGWIPASRRVITAENGTFVVTETKFLNLKITK